MPTLLSLLSLAMTAVYAWFTYRILRANQQTVALIARQLNQEHQLRVREQFLTGITSVIQYDLASPGCTQSLRLFELLCALALQAHESNRRELMTLLDTAQSLSIISGIRSDADRFPCASFLLEELEQHSKIEAWMSTVARDRHAKP